MRKTISAGSRILLRSRPGERVGPPEEGRERSQQLAPCALEPRPCRAKSLLGIDDKPCVNAFSLAKRFKVALIALSAVWPTGNRHAGDRSEAIGPCDAIAGSQPAIQQTASLRYNSELPLSGSNRPAQDLLPEQLQLAQRSGPRGDISSLGASVRCLLRHCSPIEDFELN
jgi:hypothetical protein